MILHGFIHADAQEVFRSNVTQFVNDKTTHPIMKYQAFIVALLLILSGLLILFLWNGERIFGHSYWKHWFVVPSFTDQRIRYDEDDVFDGYCQGGEMSEAAIFRQAIEGMTTKTNTTSVQGKAVVPDTEAPERIKKTPCGTDCGQYLQLKSKINELTKYVNAVKDQTDEIKQTDNKLQQLGKQIQDLNKTLSPGGQVNIKIE